jgi:hypothetical protein
LFYFSLSFSKIFSFLFFSSSKIIYFSFSYFNSFLFISSLLQFYYSSESCSSSSSICGES